MKRPDEAIARLAGDWHKDVYPDDCCPEDDTDDVLAYLAHVEAVSALRGAECRASRAAVDAAPWGIDTTAAQVARHNVALAIHAAAMAATDAAGALDE